MNKLFNGDCLEVMNDIEDHSIDCIICDIPYGTTNCSWDSIIPFEPMWEQLNRIKKENSAILLFGSEPFSSHLRLSNIKNFKYDLYWVKEKPTNFLQLKKRFGKSTEIISVFYNKQCTYNPQKYNVDHRVSNKPSEKNAKFRSIVSGVNKNLQIKAYQDDGTRYPNDILYFNREKLGSTFHPTQKPVELIKFLVKTFSNENDIVLDFTMGSGTTGVACTELNRNFIGIELDKNYFEIARRRIEESERRNILN